MKRENGFTLVELMVVIVIVGVLAAVAIPKFSMAGTKAKLSEIASFEATARENIELYYLEYGTLSSLTDSDLDNFGADLVGTVSVKKLHWSPSKMVYLSFYNTGPVPAGFIRMIPSSSGGGSLSWVYTKNIDAKYDSYFPAYLR